MKQKGYILVVENDDLIRDLLERWLGEAGYAVIAADQGAMRAPRRADAPCLVIVNLASPRGAQPLIRSLQAVYAAPILVVSGRFRRGLAGSAEAAHRLGVRKVSWPASSPQHGWAVWAGGARRRRSVRASKCFVRLATSWTRR